MSNFMHNLSQTNLHYIYLVTNQFALPIFQKINVSLSTLYCYASEITEDQMILKSIKNIIETEVLNEQWDMVTAGANIIKDIIGNFRSHDPSKIETFVYVY